SCAPGRARRRTARRGMCSGPRRRRSVGGIPCRRTRARRRPPVRRPRRQGARRGSWSRLTCLAPYPWRRGATTMAKLVYTAITSLDGYEADERGRWDFSVPGVESEYAALWRDCDKVVHSRTLTEPRTARTRGVDRFDSAEVA